MRFDILHSPPPPVSANEQSCVLRVATAQGAVLLPGDVGIRGEYQMLLRELTADVLLAPHHGSRSSSSYAFIRAVSPGCGVQPLGTANMAIHIPRLWNDTAIGCRTGLYCDRWATRCPG